MVFRYCLFYVTDYRLKPSNDVCRGTFSRFVGNVTVDIFSVGKPPNHLCYFSGNINWQHYSQCRRTGDQSITDRTTKRLPFPVSSLSNLFIFRCGYTFSYKNKPYKNIRFEMPKG